MSITIQKFDAEIRFTVSGVLCQSISDWERGIDARVFEEQLNTGLFRGQPFDDDYLQMMRLAKEQGYIMPYYGVGGSRGACSYSFRMAGTGYTINVKNEVTGDFIQLKDALDSTIGFEMDEPSRQFNIEGQEYSNLQGWEYWSDKEAFTPRYIYRFGSVSLGRLGYTIKIEDTIASKGIDVTCYEDW